MPRMNPELARIRDRCFIDPDTGCWLWRTSGNPNKPPNVYTTDYSKDPSGQTKTVQSGTKAVWHAKYKKPVPQGHVIYRIKCRNPMCLNPEHFVCITRAQVGEFVAANGFWKNNMARIIANRTNGRKRARATPEQIRLILASDRPATHLAQELGLTQTIVLGVRTGKLIYARNAAITPWAGILGASS